MASINPYWKEAEWRDFFRGSVQSLLEEINSFTSGEYQLDIEIIDRYQILPEIWARLSPRGCLSISRQACNVAWPRADRVSASP
jgi:hypothetical protein